MPIATFLLAAVVATTTQPASLPRGNELFRLGMTRAQVDSAVAGRALTVISDGTAFLVCASDDPLIEYEQYSFFLPPHGTELLWKVTLGYRLEASRRDLDTVFVRLAKQLGPPTGDSAADSTEDDGRTPSPAARQVIWSDPSTVVRLGGRWSEEPDRNADRMLVTWTDTRIQRMVEARRKKDKAGAK